MSILAIVGITIGAVVLALIVAAIIWLVVTYNFLVKLRNTVDDAFVALNEQFKRRHESAPSVLNSIKNAVKNEEYQEILDLIDSAKKKKNSTIQLTHEKELSCKLAKLFADVEKKTTVITEKSYEEDKHELDLINDEIENASKYYNAATKIYNAKRMMFPSNILAKWFKFEPYTIYEVEVVELEAAS